MGRPTVSGWHSASIISMDIKVCHGIADYYHSVSGSTSEIPKVIRYLEGFSNILEIISNY